MENTKITEESVYPGHDQKSSLNRQSLPLLTITKAAKEKGCSKSTIYRLQRKGKITFEKKGNKNFVVRDSQFEELLKNSQETADQEPDNVSSQNETPEEKVIKKIQNDHKLAPEIVAERLGQQDNRLLEFIAKGDLFVLNGQKKSNLKSEDAPLLALAEAAKRQQIAAEEMLKLIQERKVTSIQGSNGIYIVNDYKFNQLQKQKQSQSQQAPQNLPKTWKNSKVAQIMRKFQQMEARYLELKQQITQYEATCKQQINQIRQVTIINKIEKDYDFIQKLSHEKLQECEKHLAELSETVPVRHLLWYFEKANQELENVANYYQQITTFQRITLLDLIHPNL